MNSNNIPIIGDKTQKKEYWQRRMHARLGTAFDSVAPSLRELMGMAAGAEVNTEKLKGAFMIVAHGFEQAQRVINGESDVIETKLEVKKDEVKEEIKNG